MLARLRHRAKLAILGKRMLFVNRCFAGCFWGQASELGGSVAPSLAQVVWAFACRAWGVTPPRYQWLLFRHVSLPCCMLSVCMRLMSCLARSWGSRWLCVFRCMQSSGHYVETSACNVRRWSGHSLLKDMFGRLLGWSGLRVLGHPHPITIVSKTFGASVSEKPFQK